MAEMNGHFLEQAETQMWTFKTLVPLVFFFAIAEFAFSQETPPVTPPADTEPSLTERAGDALGGAADKAKEVLADVPEQVDALKTTVDQSPTAQEVTAGLLQPIYVAAESLASPWFHWLAFTLMATSVVSYALQLVFGKLVVLSRAGFSLKEILSDTLGLVVSLLGLILTTQASAENSTFTQSSASVLSAAGVGLVLGFVFYLWGQSQEVEAAKGRSVKAAEEKAKA